MNDNAKAWVAALRSGEFEQGTGELRTADDCYCCLGVACEVYRRETGEGRWHTSNGASAHYFEISEDDSAEAVLPVAVAQWLGLGRNTWGRYRVSPESMSCLTRDNDSDATFTDIADLAESEPEGLFA